MNSFRSLVRQSISLGTNAFQEKDKPPNHGNNSEEDIKTLAESEGGGFVEDDNNIYQEVIENEEFDSSTGTWKPVKSDLTQDSGVIDGKMHFPAISIPDEDNFVAGEWEVESDSDYDDDGWSYGNDFNELDLGDCLKEFSKGKVRRRIWQRLLKQRAPLAGTNSGKLSQEQEAESTLKKRQSHRFPIFNAISGKINGTITGMAQTASASLESAKDVSSGIIRQAEQTIVTAAASVPTIGKSSSSTPHSSSQRSSNTNNPTPPSVAPTTATPVQPSSSTTNLASASHDNTAPVNEYKSLPEDVPIPGVSPPSIPSTLSTSAESDSSIKGGKDGKEVGLSMPFLPSSSPVISSSPSRSGLVTPPIINTIQANKVNLGSVHSTSDLTVNISDDSNSATGGSVNVDDNIAFEYEDDASRGDAESVISDAYSIAPTEFGAPSGSGAQKRRSFFSSAFGSSSSSTVKGIANSPKEGGQTSANRRQSLKPVVRDTDPALRVHDSTLAAIGKQIKFIENEAKKVEEEKLKTWKEEVRPHLESTIADLEKRVLTIKKSIEKEADKGYQHISKLEDELEKVIIELDVAKRCYYFPYTDITLGTGGVYLALNDFWLEYCSGGYHVEITPDRSFPCISLRLRGVKGAEASGVQARLQLEGFRLAGDKGKGVPKLNFSQIKITIGFTADILLKFNHKLNKWEINPKDFKINVLSFKGPYGMNRSIVGLVLSLLTPTIRHQLVDNLPFELGLMIKTMPTPFTIIGDFNIRGVELSTLEKEWYQSLLLAKMCEYSSTQMDMFYYLQRAMERSYPMKNCAELLSYVKQFSKNRFMWDQLVHLWEQAAMLYCEKVAVQKGGSELEFMDTNGLIGMPGYKITFKTFLGMCEEMLMKRINIKCELKYIDGQFSLNHMVSFMYQIVHRLTSEAATTATSYKKVRLLALIDRMNKSYEETSKIVSIMAQNLDFVQVVVQASARSGPEGSFHALATDICAQAPLSLDLTLTAPKNIGALPLIPYVFSFRPQANGDILLEAYHFNHDSSDVPSLLRGLHVPSHNDEARVRSETMGSASSAPSTSAASGNVVTSGGLTIGGEDNFTGNRDSESDAGMWNHISREHKFTNYENSIRTGVYSTSYNRVVNKIATGQATIRALGLSALRLQQAAEAEFDDLQPVDANLAGNGISGVWGLTHAEDAALTEEWKHLLIKRERQWQSLKRTLQDHPRGEEADTLLSVITKRPKFSVIVDRKTEFKAGAELVTVNVGKFENKNNNDNQRSASSSKSKKFTTEAGDTTNDAGDSYNQMIEDEEERTSDKAEEGVPIAVHTAGEIRLFTQIESAEVSLHLPTLLRFVLAHFADLTLLRQYLEILSGLEFLDEHLMVFKLVLERMAKYLLLPVVALDININAKLVALNGEIMILIETPQQPLSPMGQSSQKKSQMPPTGPAFKIPDSAIELDAQISLRELLQDAIDIDNLIRFGTGESYTSNSKSSGATK